MRRTTMAHKVTTFDLKLLPEQVARFPVRAGTLVLCAVLATIPAWPAAAERTGEGGSPHSVEELTALDQVKQLCLASRAKERVYFSDDDEGRRAGERYSLELQRLQRQLFKVRVPASAFELLPYSTRTGELRMAADRPLPLLHGAVRLNIPSTESAAFLVTAEQAGKIQELAASGDLWLDYFFLLSTQLGSACQGSVSTQVYSVSTTPVAFFLRDGNNDALARDDSLLADSYREALGGFTGVPGVFLGAVSTERSVNPAEVAARLDAMLAPVRSCYESRLSDRPGAAGTVVLGVGVGASGGVQTVDVIADALMDEPLLSCIESELRKVRFVGLNGLPTLFRVPVELRRVPARGASSPGQ